MSVAEAVAAKIVALGIARKAITEAVNQAHEEAIRANPPGPGMPRKEAP